MRPRVIAITALIAAAVVLGIFEAGGGIGNDLPKYGFIACLLAAAGLTASLPAERTPRFLRPGLFFACISGAAYMLAFMRDIVFMWSLAAFYVTAAAAIVFLAMALISAAGKKLRRGKEPRSGWKMFAVGVIVLLVLDVVLGVIDIMTSTGFMAGLAGAVLLYYGAPLLLGLLALEFMIWSLWKDFIKKKDTSDGDAPVRITLDEKDK